MSERKVFLVGFWPDYEVFFFQDKGVDVSIFDPSKEVTKSFYFKYLPRHNKNKYYITCVKQLMLREPTALFIFQDSRIFLEFLAELNDKKKRCCIIFRNSINTNERVLELLPYLKAKAYPLWSFDHDDCLKYGLQLYPQFIRAYDEVRHIAPVYDFSFVGRDKGRAALLYEFKEKAESKGLTVYLNILSDNSKNTLSYREYLDAMCQGRCFIDWVKPDQTGLTLRPLEALIYQRKIITNNINVEKEMCAYKSNIKYLNELTVSTELLAFIGKQWDSSTLADESLFSTKNALDLMTTDFLSGLERH